jgi:SAM-dependent methyltransferase
MLVKTPLYAFWKNTLASGLKKKRLRAILSLSGYRSYTGSEPLRVLEVGCGNGRDAVQFLADPRYCVTGVDIKPAKIEQANFTFMQADAEALPFGDDAFDLVISVGLLEHIEPIEKLARVISEINRVGKAYVNIVPSVSTPLEPHALRLFWPRRLQKRFVHKRSARQILKLNFFSDHTWTKFEGFSEADVARKWYLFPLVRNTFIYKRTGTA